MKNTYPLVAPRFVIEFINEEMLDAFDVMRFVSGIKKGIHLLNKEVLVYPPKTLKEDEGFAAWGYSFSGDDGKFYVSADQPHYVKKGLPRDYVWNGKEFVPAPAKKKR